MRIKTDTINSTTLRRIWRYNVYLPPGYEHNDLAYPVVYLLHGSGGDETSWNQGLEVLDQLVVARELPSLIAVAPSSGQSWWVDTLEPFETAFIRDLVPEIDGRYRTIAQREGRAIAGFSMGGYGAVRYALMYSEMFSAATVLSPALYDGQPPPDSSARTTGAFGNPFDPALWTHLNYPSALKTYRSKQLQVPLFITAGDDDWNEPAGWKYNVEYQSVLLFERLHKEGKSAAKLRIAHGDHDWKLWGPMFSEGLKYMAEFLSFQQVVHHQAIKET